MSKQLTKRPTAKPVSEPERERMDRVLQARVSESLYRQLAEQAARLRVPVSNLVRNILEDSTRFLGHIVDGGFEIVQALNQHASEAELDAVLGWQPMSANKQMECAHCGATIAKGDKALLSVGAPGGRSYVICKKCKED